MSTFEFVSVLMSIVVGLGVTRLLSSTAALIEHRGSVRPDFVSLVWAANVLQYLVIYWWVVVGNWRSLSTWSFAGFVLLFLYGVFLYFCASLILPARVEAGLDLTVRYEAIRRPFFAMWLLVIGAEVVDSFLKGAGYVLAELGVVWFVINGAMAALAMAALWVSDRRFHGTFGVLTFLVYAAWTLGVFGSM